MEKLSNNRAKGGRESGQLSAALEVIYSSSCRLIYPLRTNEWIICEDGEKTAQLGPPKSLGNTSVNPDQKNDTESWTWEHKKKPQTPQMRR